MRSFGTAAFTVFGTVLGGAVVLVLGQWVQRFIMEPIQEQRRVVGEIAHALTFDANVGYIPGEEHLDEDYRKKLKERVDETHLRLRGLAARLSATLWTVPFYAFFERRGWVPSADDVNVASTELIGWSNGLESRDGPENARRQKRIAEKLGIRSTD
jgi:hypothetical protein